MANGNTKRRAFLKRAGIVGTSIGIAGCVSGISGDGGGSGGNEGGGGTNTGSGGGGNASGGGSSGSGKQTLRVGLPPLGPSVLALQRIRDQTNILSTEMEAAGYNVNVTETWDEITLFAAGKTDLTPSLSDIEGARIAAERDMPITFHGLYATNYEGLYVRKGSKWDPDKSGSVKATIDMLANGEGTWGNAGWNQGSVTAGQICMKNEFGYDYGPDKSDFNVRQAEWSALPRLLADGQLAMCTNGPPLGSAIQLAQDDNPIKDIYWYQPGLKKANLSPKTANLGMFGTRKDFADNHRPAIKAYMKAWKEGVKWVSNPDNFEKILSSQENISALGGNNREEAKIILEFSQQPPKHCMAKPGNLARVILEDITIDRDFVKTDKQALERAAKLGSIPSGYKDLVNYSPIKF